MKKGYVSISQESSSEQQQQEVNSSPLPATAHPVPQYMSDMHHEKMSDDDYHPPVAYSRTTTANRFFEWCRQTYHGDRHHNANAPLLPSEKRHVTFQEQQQYQARTIRPRSKVTKFLAGAAVITMGVLFLRRFTPESEVLFQGKYNIL